MARLVTKWSADQRERAMSDGKVLVMFAMDDELLTDGNLGACCITALATREQASALLKSVMQWKDDNKRESQCVT